MTHNNVLVAILGLLSAFSAFGSENTAPSKLDIGVSIVKAGCVGGLGCAGLTYCLGKKNISKDELLLAGGAGFFTFAFGSACIAAKNQSERIYNLSLPEKPVTQHSPIQIRITQEAIKFKPFDDTKM